MHDSDGVHAQLFWREGFSRESSRCCGALRMHARCSVPEALDRAREAERGNTWGGEGEGWGAKDAKQLCLVPQGRVIRSSGWRLSGLLSFLLRATNIEVCTWCVICSLAFTYKLDEKTC